jgi:hypothetical protein
MMRQLFPAPEPEELDEETAEIVARVCEDVRDYDGSLLQTKLLRDKRFGQDLFLAALYAPTVECRAAVFKAAEQMVKISGEFISAEGVIYPKEMIGEHEGRIRNVVADGGGIRRALEWPADYFSDGSPFYDEHNKTYREFDEF